MHDYRLSTIHTLTHAYIHTPLLVVCLYVLYLCVLHELCLFYFIIRIQNLSLCTDFTNWQWSHVTKKNKHCQISSTLIYLILGSSTMDVYSVSLFIDGKALFSPPSLSLLRIHCPCYYYHYHLLLVLAVVTISTITMICYCHIYTACHYYDANIITATTIYQCMRRASTAITVITTDTFILINNHYYVQSLTHYLYWLLSVLFTSLSLSLRHAPSTLSLSLPSMS
jgi:hypothetical protein